ncbi:DUF2806 domain-containing protein [Acidovorax sp.]|uniref:DUF2806 domain-containing protein n=1 Tax=Acidovorax sp. TaxID=1872122 RepID=UPI0027BB106B|nr:DUF2806 domain-containing protein [Acidovorax sp.]
MPTEERTETNGLTASDALSAAVSTASEALLPVPAGLSNGALKAFSRLVGAAIDKWVAKLEAAPALTRAYTAAEVQQIATTSTRIAEQIQVPEEYAEAAWRKHAKNIVRRQTNIINICNQARDELIEPWLVEPPAEAVEGQAEVSDDWLNIFDDEAGNMSTAHMQQLFGKILAGEIRKPGSFSIRTVKLLSQLDNEAAKIFVRLCSIATAVVADDGRVVDVRALALGKRPSANGMALYGLDFASLNILLEYGLINAEFNSQMPYRSCVVEGGSVAATIKYLGKSYVLVPKEVGQNITGDVYEVGVSMTLAGRQIFEIVEPIQSHEYTKCLFLHFDKLGLAMTECEVA